MFNISNIRDKYQFKFLFLLSTAYLAVDINIQGIMALMPFIQDDFAITRAQAGLYSTSYFLTATAIAIFTGTIVDKIGSKKGLVLGTSSVGVIVLLHSLAPTFTVVLVLAFFTGLFFSIITPSLNKAVMIRVRPENRATSMGIMQMGGGVGGFLGATFLPLLGGILGWRNAIIFSGALALISGLFFYKYFEDDFSQDESENKIKNNRDKNEKDKNLRSENNDTSFQNTILILLKNKYLLMVCALGTALSFSIGSIPAHYTLFLTRDLNLAGTQAGVFLGLMQIGGIVGRPAWGWLSDRMLGGSRRRALILVGLSLTIINMFYAYVITLYTAFLPLLVISSFILGILALGWMGLYFTTIAELVTEKFTGIGTGFALVFTRSGVVISPPIFGYLADITGSYHYSWLGIGIVIFLATLIFSIISRKYEEN